MSKIDINIKSEEFLERCKIIEHCGGADALKFAINCGFVRMFRSEFLLARDEVLTSGFISKKFKEQIISGKKISDIANEISKNNPKQGGN